MKINKIIFAGLAIVFFGFASQNKSEKLEDFNSNIDLTKIKLGESLSDKQLGELKKAPKYYWNDCRNSEGQAGINCTSSLTSNQCLYPTNACNPGS